MAEQPVGEMLRRTREERAITLEEAEAQTRIRKKFLQALESGDISALPSAAHARGFLRNYAYYLGLNPDEVVQRFGEHSAAPLVDVPQSTGSTATYITPDRRTGPGLPRGLTPPEETAPPPLQQPRQLSGLSRPQTEQPAAPAVSAAKPPRPEGGMVANIITAVILAVGLIGAIVLTTMLSRVALNAPAEGSAVAGDLPTRQPSATFAPTSTLSDVVITSAPQITGRVFVSLRAEQTSWVRVTADGEIVFEDVLEPTQVITQEADTQIIVVASNAGGISVTFNGGELGLLGQRGEVVERHFTAEGDVLEPTATPTLTPTSTSVPTPTPSSTPTETGP
ncbi:MAG: helix-turn-helix domain-containing protein [Anaerolineae bacterium]